MIFSPKIFRLIPFTVACLLEAKLLYPDRLLIYRESTLRALFAKIKAVATRLIDEARLPRDHGDDVRDWHSEWYQESRMRVIWLEYSHSELQLTSSVSV